MMPRGKVGVRDVSCHVDELVRPRDGWGSVLHDGRGTDRNRATAGNLVPPDTPRLLPRRRRWRGWGLVAARRVERLGVGAATAECSVGDGGVGGVGCSLPCGGGRVDAHEEGLRQPQPLVLTRTIASLVSVVHTNRETVIGMRER